MHKLSYATTRAFRVFFIFAAVSSLGVNLVYEPAAALAQEVEAEEFEEETEELDPDLGAEEEDEELEELLEYREEQQHELERAERDAQQIRNRIKQIDELLVLRKQSRRLEAELELAEERDDEKRVAALEDEIDRIETRIDHKGSMLELEEQLAEIKEEIADADEEGEDRRVDALEQLAKSIRRVRDIRSELLPIYFEGPESKATELEKEMALEYSRAEKVYLSLRVLRQLREAEEDDDEELIEELEEKFEELQTEIGGRSQEPVESAEAMVELQPIVVTEETLAPYVAADLHRNVAPLLQKYCFACHDNDSSSGELNLEKLLTESPIVKNRDQWVNVIEQSKNHVMPPEDEAQPTSDERKQIVLSLHNAVYRFDYSEIRNPGYESARRMTHREYSNTVRDLFGIEIDVVDRFPDDLTASSGFENSANSLYIQPLLMERYVGIAEHVIAAAFPAANAPAAEEAWTRIVGGPPAAGDDPTSKATTIFRRFLLRAYRRPATQPELARAVEFVTQSVSSGKPFTEAVKAALQTVLISPKFLLRTETEHDSRGPFPVNDWELASRLSYFLWASMPDDELFALAAKGRLHEPDVLTKQVRRMIADPKADSLGSVFAAQWLGSHHLGKRVRMDPIDNPWCTESLMASMREETAMFFCSLVRENQPVTRLIDADYTYLNEELANHYRIKGVAGPEMRRVKLGTDRRGGIFGQGSLLATTSFPYRTSPVVRGRWILAEVLGTPPPPPPPNVSELSEEIEENRRLSFREKLELHRRKPNCYACHSQMDPLGFSLEKFDWFGRYRTRQGRSRIDAKGELPNGTQFDGIAGLKKVIVEQRRDDLVRQVSQKMLSYALGRQLEYYDEPAIRKIVATVASDENRLQTLVREIVASFPFQYKQVQGPIAEQATSVSQLAR